jgi:hypothetical protein
MPLFIGEMAMVGVRGFEPPTSCSQSKRATGLRYTPRGVIMTPAPLFDHTHMPRRACFRPHRRGGGRFGTPRYDSLSARLAATTSRRILPEPVP